MAERVGENPHPVAARQRFHVIADAAPFRDRAIYLNVVRIIHMDIEHDGGIRPYGKGGNAGLPWMRPHRVSGWHRQS